MAGYSDTPLAKKLGIGEGREVIWSASPRSSAALRCASIFGPSL